MYPNYLQQEVLKKSSCRFFVYLNQFRHISILYGSNVNTAASTAKRTNSSTECLNNPRSSMIAWCYIHTSDEVCSDQIKKYLTTIGHKFHAPTLSCFLAWLCEYRTALPVLNCPKSPLILKRI